MAAEVTETARVRNKSYSLQNYGYNRCNTVGKGCTHI